LGNFHKYIVTSRLKIDDAISRFRRIRREEIMNSSSCIAKVFEDVQSLLFLKNRSTTEGLAKLGNIVAETLLLLMFPWVAKLGNVCFGRKTCVRETKLQAKTFFVSEQQTLFPQHMFPARLNWEKFASATMFPSLARPLQLNIAI